jgi:hypothetical protein
VSLEAKKHRFCTVGVYALNCSVDTKAHTWFVPVLSQ